MLHPCVLAVAEEKSLPQPAAQGVKFLRIARLNIPQFPPFYHFRVLKHQSREMFADLIWVRSNC